jgi:hypothetical protein
MPMPQNRGAAEAIIPNPDSNSLLTQAPSVEDAHNTGSKIQVACRALENLEPFF